MDTQGHHFICKITKSLPSENKIEGDFNVLLTRPQHCSFSVNERNTCFAKKKSESQEKLLHFQMIPKREKLPVTAHLEDRDLSPKISAGIMTIYKVKEDS